MPLWRSTSASAVLALSVVAPAGCVTGGAAPLDEDLYGDAQCSDTSADSPTDMACHDDCVRPCGFTHPLYERASKYCVCQSGVYIECRCVKPDWYKGAQSAPYCDDFTADGLGRTTALDKYPCKAEWDECVGRDPVDGFTPKGCVCTAEADGRLVWECGSTEKWFYPDQSVAE